MLVGSDMTAHLEYRSLEREQQEIGERRPDAH